MSRRGIMYKLSTSCGWTKTHCPYDVPDGAKFRITRSYHEFEDQNLLLSDKATDCDRYVSGSNGKIEFNYPEDKEFLEKNYKS